MNLRENLPGQLLALLDQPVAVLGAGASGQAVRALLGKLGVEPVLFDERSGDGGDLRRAFTRHDAAGYGLVIHSPAFPPDHPWISAALGADCVVLSEMDFAQQLRRGPTILVTGTNGKTTLQEFITFSLKRCGISAVATGHNQYPLSRLAVRPELDGVTAVCELGAAHALPLKTFRFDALFWTNFHEEHVEDPLERRALFEGLLRLASLSPEARLYYGDAVFEAARELGCDLPQRARPLEPADYPQWELPGSSAFATRIHQPALALFRRYWLESGYSESLLKGAAENFEVRAHRLHVSSIIGKTTFWNDANAHNFAATRAALENFDAPVVWIASGQYRGGNLAAFAADIAPMLRAAVLTGGVGEALRDVLEPLDVPCAIATDLRAAVEAAFNFAAGEAPVVFSPGFVAGGEFGDIVERGICYENAVLGLKHQKGSN
jgi:UDP-N-acetylmuramoylalanine--D-glutamate ligase